MSNKENFVVYEYKDINVKRDTAKMHVDCMKNFGWTLVENNGYIIQDLLANLNPVNLGRNIANTAQSFGETADAIPTVTLKFKRDRRIENKQQLDKFEMEYEKAFSDISKIERNNTAYTMGTALGAGIVGTAILGLAAYSFISANTVMGVILAVFGFAGWGIGFFAHRMVQKKKTMKTEPKIQEHLDLAYSACEQAHALMA